MDIRQLRYFVAIAQSGSFTAASRALRVSQPALSAQVGQLEQHLGVSLLTRHSRGIELTPAGEVMFRHATEVLDNLRQAELELAPFRYKHQIKISLGVTPSSGRWLVPALLDACVRAQGLAPQIALRQELSSQLLRQIVQKQIDMAFCYDAPASESYCSRPLYFESFSLVGPPAMVNGDAGELPFEELARYQLVLGGRTHVTRQVVEQTAAQRGVELNIGLDVDPIALRREMLTKHNRCSIMPPGLVLDDISSGHLAARRIGSPRIGRTLILVARHGLDSAVFDFVVTTISPVVRRMLRDRRLEMLDAAEAADHFGRRATAEA